jgi:hypothetical protein
MQVGLHPYPEEPIDLDSLARVADAGTSTIPCPELREGLSYVHAWTRVSLFVLM